MAKPEDTKCRLIAIDKRGVTLTRQSYDRIGYFSEGLASVEDNGSVGYIDKSGATPIPLRLRGGGTFKQGLAPFSEEGLRWGYMDNHGRTVIPQQFYSADSFSDGAALVGVFNGKLWFIDTQGNKLFGGREFTAATGFHLGLAHVAVGDAYAYINRAGVEVFRYHQPRSRPF